MADRAESESGRSPKSAGEPDRVSVSVKFEAQEGGCGSPTQDASVVSQGFVNSVDGTASSWAPRPPTADGASASMASSSARSPGRKDGKSAKRKTNLRATIHANDPSLTERLGNSALSSTLEILKLAGGVTLSTTGTILSPSLEMTKNLILPSLFAGISDYVGQISPQRLKDWFRIVSASIHHLIAVVVSTERGSIFRHKVVRLGGDVVDVVSSDTSRQALMDGIACFVKLNEALHTPEFKAFLEQASVLGCRVVDAAAMGNNKKLIHDFYDLVWSGIELTNDPATTVAFAEVAAYLCHALEMEDAAIHAIAKQREEINRVAAQKRRERDQYQSATYQESYLFSDPNATVEEVILSAFGVIEKSVEEAKMKSGELDNDIPGSVVLGSDDGGESERPSRAVTPTPEAEAKVGAGEQEDYEDKPNTPKEDDAMALDTNDIDVNYLREKITQRAETTKKEHTQKRTSIVTELNARKLASIRQVSAITDVLDDGKMDIEELASLTKEETPKQRNDNKLHFEDSSGNQADENAEIMSDPSNEEVPSAPDRQDRAEPREGETPVAHFYRVLDEVLTDERTRVAGTVLQRTGSNSLEGVAELTSGSLKRHVQDHQSEKRSKPKASSGLPPAAEKFINENEMLVCGLVLGALGLGLLFCLFGCYGMYVFVFPSRIGHLTVADPQAFAGSGMHVPLIIPDDNDRNEYVIRVVREVVHVNAKGETLRIQRSDEL